MSYEKLLLWEWRVGLAVFGAVVGSFLNVCIHRLPRGESVVKPRSRCPQCGQAIAAWQNIPVLSWLILRGRCGHCRAPISARYPLVELLNSGLWLAAGLNFGISVQALVLLPLLSALLALFFTDLDEMLLPDAITLPLAVCGIVVAPWNGRLDLAPQWLGSGTIGSRLAHALLGAAFGYLLFLAIAVVGKLVFRKDAMGGGDLKLMLAVGAFLGMPSVVLTLFLGSIIGSLISLPFLLGGRWSMGKMLPFGCFLTPAAAIAAFVGNEFVIWYVGLVVGRPALGH